MVSKLLVVFLFISVGLAYNAKYGGELYQDGKNARNAAMGGLSVSYADGCNPVLLKNKQTPSIHFSHKNKFGGLAQVTILSYFHPGKKYPFYLGLTNRSVDNIPNTESAWEDDGNSVPESGEINYFNVHQITQQEIGIQLSTIRIWGPYTLGFNLKPSFMSLADYRGYGITGDVAAMFQPFNKLDLTLRMKDIMGLKYWDSGTLETLSLGIIGGIHYRFSSIAVGLETGSRIEKYSLLHYHAGIEYEQQEQLFIRLGTSHNNIITAGFGIKLPFMDFDYAYLQPSVDTPFKETHVLSVGIYLDDMKLIKGKMTP